MSPPLGGDVRSWDNPSVPRWSERHGLTLEMESVPHEHFVRISIMERVGLLGGLFNVREARAEAESPGSAAVRLIGEGRALSWRWLREHEARALYEHRLMTLRTLGYRPLPETHRVPGRWDWLHALMQRRLRSSPEAPPPEPAPLDLRAVVARIDPLLGTTALAPVAEFLGCSLAELLEPRVEAVRTLPSEAIALLLSYLLHHEHRELQEVGERWFRCAPLLYQIAGSDLLRWLQREPELAPRFAPRIRREGLALLGPEHLDALALRGPAPLRGPAQMWLQRINRVW